MGLFALWLWENIFPLCWQISFHHDFHLTKVRLVDKCNRLLFKKFQNSDNFYPGFLWVMPLRICRLKLLVLKQEAVLSKGFRFCFPTKVSYSKIISKVESGNMASIDKVEAPQKLSVEIVRKLKTFNMKKLIMI